MKANSFIFIFSLFFLISCSQEATVIKEINSKIIYEYKDAQTLPSQRLSVFVATNGDVRKFDSLYVKDLESDFYWETKDLFRFTNGDKNYAGYSSFIVPEGDSFNDGEYSLVINTKSKEELAYNFNLTYNKDFIKMKFADALQEMKNNGAVENICIYDEDGKIIYYGKRSEDLYTNRDIWLKYNNAAKYNSIWALDNRAIMCIMPAEIVTPGDKNE